MLALKFLVLIGLFSFSQAQCAGTLTNSTQNVSVSWTVTGNNTVSFSFTAPANTSQYVGLSFSKNNIGFTISTTDDLAQVDVVIAGNNGSNSFVEDRWIANVSESGGPRYDANQDIMNASASLSNGLLTVNFTRPIIIIIIWQNATTEDVSLDDCRFIGFAYGGIAESFVSPVNISGPMSIGLFDRQICLQTCQFSEVSPSPTLTMSTSTTTTIAPTPSVSASPCGAAELMASLAILIIAIVLAISFQ